MFRRKLTALDSQFGESFNPQDEMQFRNLVLWLEDQKIRHYKIEERENLRQLQNNDVWNQAFDKYLKDVNCPFSSTTGTDRNALVDWLLGFAVRLEYGDNAKIYQEKMASNNAQSKDDQTNLVSQNPLDKLDFDEADFRQGIENLAKLLNVTKHPDHLVTLKAICKLVTEKLSNQAVKETTENPTQSSQGIQIQLQNIDLGFDTGDDVLNNAAKVIRLLHINESRDLQTRINETIVALQQVSADPKTDDRLGKIGS